MLHMSWFNEERVSKIACNELWNLFRSGNLFSDWIIVINELSKMNSISESAQTQYFSHLLLLHIYQNKQTSVRCWRKIIENEQQSVVFAVKMRNYLKASSTCFQENMFIFLLLTRFKLRCPIYSQQESYFNPFLKQI